MITPEMRELLNDPRVKEEISKHRWYESEKRKADVGYEYACEDWLKRYSSTWMKKNIKVNASGSMVDKLKKLFK